MPRDTLFKEWEKRIEKENKKHFKETSETN